MANSVELERALSLAGKNFGASGAAVTPLDAGYRCSLRAAQSDAAALSKALGVDLPQSPKGSARSGSRNALWLGPDEWLIYDSKINPAESLNDVTATHCAVDVSHRNTGIEVSGPMAADIIAAGCPQDLSDEKFPVGACSRTIMGKIEIVLYRSAKTVYHVECWRSFAPYAFELLCTAAKDQSALAAR